MNETGTGKPWPISLKRDEDDDDGDGGGGDILLSPHSRNMTCLLIYAPNFSVCCFIFQRNSYSLIRNESLKCIF
jgi:hypothetical protein